MLGTAETGKLDSDVSDPIKYFKNTHVCTHKPNKKPVTLFTGRRNIWTPRTAVEFRSFFPYMWPSVYPEWKCVQTK